jgi:hypothetical protein
MAVSEATSLKPDKFTPESEKNARRLEKLEAERGLLDPADRYKALVNAVEASQDLIALVIMSVLNAVAVLLVVRGGTVSFPRTGIFGALVPVEFALYAVVTVYYISQAISALRPRGVKPPPSSQLPSQVEAATSMRVLFYADVVARERAEYRELWSNLRMDNLTTELSDQLYTLSVINSQKFRALARLYFGLTVMTVLLAIVIGTVGLAQYTR